MSTLPDSGFAEVVQLISTARQRAMQAVNTSLIDLYWQVGAIISCKIHSAEWGDGVVAQLATHIARSQPGLRGFTRPNLFRMRQFYEAYRDDEKVSALLRQLPWTHHLIILSQSKRPEEREFYLRMAIGEQWSSRELERQFRTALFERTVLTPPKATAVLTQTHPGALAVFKDAYLVEFLDLPSGHVESDLHRGLLHQLKDFLIELGRDFCFVGSEFPLQVGGRDFALDLLFFSSGVELPRGDRVEGRTLRAGVSGKARLLSGGPGPRREEAAREPGHRRVAVREQGRGGRRICPQP